jgi:hypothetical protein
MSALTRFADSSRTSPKVGEVPQPAVSRCSNCSCAKGVLFDHLVGAGEQRRRLDAERPRSLDVDKQLGARLSRQMYAPSDV